MMSTENLPRRVLGRLRGLFLLPDVVAGLNNLQRQINELKNAQLHTQELLEQGLELQRAQLVMQRDQIEALDRLAVTIRGTAVASPRSPGLEETKHAAGVSSA
jgi:hypothetical protein